MKLWKYWDLALLTVFVLIGIAGGLTLAVFIGQWTHGAAFAFAHGLGTILTTFGSCTACVVLTYLLATQVIKLLRRKERAQVEKGRQQKTTRKRRRKKQL